MRLLGVDYGTRHIGLAVAEGPGVVLPLSVVDASVTTVLRTAKEIDAQEFVLGLPLNMNGSEGPAARRVKRFAEELQVRSGLPVHLVDERLTSFEAERRLAGIPIPRAKRKQAVQRVSAQVILETYLQQVGDSPNA
jgi:putative Holliday junction resolvase